MATQNSFRHFACNFAMAAKPPNGITVFSWLGVLSVTSRGLKSYYGRAPKAA